MTTAISLPTAGAYRVDPERSTVSFRTRHLFGLAPVRGTFRLRTGQLTVADPVTASTATATIAAGSFDTGLSARDRTVRSGQYLDVVRHPDIPTAPKGNGTQPSHRHVPNWTASTQRNHAG